MPCGMPVLLEGLLGLESLAARAARETRPVPCVSPVLLQRLLIGKDLAAHRAFELQPVPRGLLVLLQRHLACELPAAPAAGEVRRPFRLPLRLRRGVRGGARGGGGCALRRLALRSRDVSKGARVAIPAAARRGEELAKRPLLLGRSSARCFGMAGRLRLRSSCLGRLCVGSPHLRLKRLCLGSPPLRPGSRCLTGFGTVSCLAAAFPAGRPTARCIPFEKVFCLHPLDADTEAVAPHFLLHCLHQLRLPCHLLVAHGAASDTNDLCLLHPESLGLCDHGHHHLCLPLRNPILPAQVVHHVPGLPESFLDVEVLTYLYDMVVVLLGARRYHRRFSLSHLLRRGRGQRMASN
mmetsp:Transcript_30889/g.98607  ORF Transcript_30889/g.98607 Transcript_30889/m.98607 type:complete len:351 (+) Transcript_30889:305-1357(+)